MRKILFIAMMLVLMLILASCMRQETSNPSVNTVTPGNLLDIQIQSPMTLSNTMCTYNGQTAYLRLKMVKGRYYEDWNPGAYMGTLWEGNFVIELADEYGRTIDETDINRLFSEPLVFKSSFNLEFDDYNNDGNLDFTIGQYGSSNGNLYKILTLRKDGKVEELPVKDHPDLFISNSTGYYSTKLKKIDGTAFAIEYYDNSITATFHDLYQWDGKQFVLSKSQKMTQEVIPPQDNQTDSINRTLEQTNGSTDVSKLSLTDVKINGKKVSASSGIINEYGFNIGIFCKEICPDMKLHIIEYSKKTFGGYKGSNVPIRFKISSGEKSVEFEGVSYASSVNGEPVAEYIAGKFGEIRAKYKNYLYLDNKESVGRFLDSLGIGYTFYDDKSIDICN